MSWILKHARRAFRGAVEVTRETILALSNLISFTNDSVEGYGDDYSGDAVGDNRSRPIQPGRCYLFDGTNDYITLGDNSVTEIGSNTSWTFIVRVLLTSSSGGNKTLVSKLQQSGDGEYVLAYNTSANRFRFAVNDGSFRFVDASTFGAASADTWYTVIAQHDGPTKTLKIAVDSVTYNTATYPGTLVTSSSFDARIGALDDNSQYLDGCISFVGKWNSVLSDSDVNAFLSSNTLPASAQWLFKCDESSGSTIYDSSGNDNKGKAINATASSFHATDTGIVKSWQNDFGNSTCVFFAGASIGTGYINCPIGELSTMKTFYIEINRNKSFGTNEVPVTFTNNDHLLFPSGSTAIRFVAGGSTIQGTTDVSDNEWHSVAGVYGASDTLLYINGSEEATKGSSTSITVTRLVIGNFAKGSGNQWEGFVRRFLIYDTELSASQITEVNNGTDIPTGLSSSNVLRNYNFTTGTGRTLIDDSDNALHGTFDTTNVDWNFIPRDESDTTNDITGSALDYTGRVKYDFNLVGSNCVTFDGVDDYIDFGSVGNISSFSGYVKLLVDNQELFTVDSTTGGAITVSGGTLTAGGSITIDSITVDGFSKTASEAGALLNDNLWHLLAFNITDGVNPYVNATGLEYGTDGSAFGNINAAGWNFSDTVVTPMSEGSETIVYDVSGNSNDGTLTNFTLSNAWGTTQNVYHYNIKNGFEHYDDDATGLDILRVPYKTDGSQITPTISGYTKNSNNPAGYWHNNAETDLNAPESPAMRIANDNEGNDFLFVNTTINNAQDISYTDIDDNVNNSGYFFADISEANKKKNLLIFDEEKTGSDLAAIQDYLNH